MYLERAKVQRGEGSPFEDFQQWGQQRPRLLSHRLQRTVAR